MIEQIYEAATDDDAYAALPGALAAAVGARSSTFQIIEDGAPVHVATSYFTPEMGDYYVARGIGDLDIWNTMVVARGLTNRALSSDELMSRADFSDTAFFNDFFRVFGDDTGVSLGSVITTERGFIGLGLHRAVTARRYDPQDVARLNTAIPHLKRMVDIRSRLSTAVQRAAGLEAALDAHGHGVILTDRQGRVQFCNRYADRILRTGDALGLIAGRLVAVDQACQPALHKAVASVGVGLAGGAVWARRLDGSGCRLLICPHRSTLGLLGALILFDDTGQSTGDHRAALRTLYGLTQAEADLAHLLFEGLSPKEAAEARGVSLATVQTQLKSIRSRTETVRHSELIGLIGALVRPAARE